MQECGGFLVRQTFRADIGNAIAFGVAAAAARIPGEVHAKAVWRAKARAFANQDYARFCAENFADRIGDGHARLFHNTNGRDAPFVERPKSSIEKRSEDRRVGKE